MTLNVQQKHKTFVQILADNSFINEDFKEQRLQVTYSVLFGQMVAKCRSSNDSSHVLTSQGDHHISCEHTDCFLSGKLDLSCTSPEVFYNIIHGGENGYG